MINIQFVKLPSYLYFINHKIKRYVDKNSSSTMMMIDRTGANRQIGR
jgi:hypothetical protein